MLSIARCIRKGKKIEDVLSSVCVSVCVCVSEHAEKHEFLNPNSQHNGWLDEGAT